MAKGRRRKVAPEGIAPALKEIADAYAKDKQADVAKATEAAARYCEESLHATSPRREGGGRYASGWTTDDASEGTERPKYRVHNKTDYQLTHLLEKGHLTRNHLSRVPAQPHIRPAAEAAKERFRRDLRGS